MGKPGMKILATAIITLLLIVNSAGAQKLPVSTTIGTNPAGTAFYAVSAGLAKVISGVGPMQSIVQPYTGSSTFLPLLDSGELDFGIINAVEMNLGYQGPAKVKIGGKNPLPHVPNTRLIMRGSPLRVSLVVRKDSPIKSLQDIKGKRVTGEYPANIAIWYHVYTELANAGLTWDDVKVVPVPAVNDGVDALVQGRADVSNHAIGVAKIKEADAAVGVRFLSLDCSAQGDARVRKAVPGYYLITLKSGSSTGIVGDTCVLAYDIYMVGHKGLSNEVVTHSLKAIWDNIDKLPPLNPQFNEWTRERAASADVTIPYHPAAVQFYKDHKLWTAAMDESQKRLLAVNP
ncbi:MAG TPA: TAXI family TRAP transporter solute-binding subunit [Candidatus Limnocylindrales bacterium]|nr:TAXI family TRAP transporter solute-binding subunit [Candidatus Limnocylindrales bacterium]